ncbi:MAG TPA: hypothetical protein VF695_08335, partial [Sphingomonas sp.]
RRELTLGERSLCTRTLPFCVSDYLLRGSCLTEHRSVQRQCCSNNSEQGLDRNQELHEFHHIDLNVFHKLLDQDNSDSKSTKLTRLTYPFPSSSIAAVAR